MSITSVIKGNPISFLKENSISFLKKNPTLLIKLILRTTQLLSTNFANPKPTRLAGKVECILRSTPDPLTFSKNITDFSSPNPYPALDHVSKAENNISYFTTAKKISDPYLGHPILGNRGGFFKDAAINMIPQGPINPSSIPLNSTPPFHFASEKPKNVNEDIFQTQTTTQAQPSISEATMAASKTLKALAEKPSFFWIAAPFFLWIFCRNKEKQSEDINLNIAASAHKKIYRITWEKEDTCLTTTIEVTAGQPLKLLENDELETNDHLDAIGLYHAQSGLKKSKLNLFNIFERKQKENHAILNINIHETLKNKSLEEPKTYGFPLSDKQFIHINHLPYGLANKNQFLQINADSDIEADEVSRHISINIPSSSTSKQILHFPLPIDENICNEYLHVEQL